MADGVVPRLATLIVLAVVTAGCADRGEPTVTAPANSSSVVGASSTETSTPTSTTLPDAATLTAALQAVVDEFASSQPVPFSVVVLDVRTGARVEHLGDRRVRSASLYKLFVARELLRRIHGGTLQGDAPAHDTEGRTVDECLRDMIVVSDNDCGVAGLNLVGGGTQDSALHRDGFVTTSLASPQQTSADDVVLFLTETLDGTLLGPGSTDPSTEMYDLLRAQQVNDRLPTGLPPGAPIAHKTGDIIGWAHDAGIISTPHGDVVLAVLSGPWPAPCCDADHPGPAEQVAFGAIADLGRRVYDVVA